MGKSSKHFWEVTDELAQRIWDEEISCEQACDECPFNGQCHDQKLYFKCAVWEEAMSEDL